MSESNDAIVERAKTREARISLTRMRRSLFIGRCGICLQISVPYLAQMYCGTQVDSDRLMEEIEQ